AGVSREDGGRRWLRWRRSAMVRVMMNGGSPRAAANGLRMMKSDGGVVFEMATVGERVAVRRRFFVVLLGVDKKQDGGLVSGRMMMVSVVLGEDG
ncbi:hypothetical protein Dimus_036575, partial [Dionaea muscipula]